MVFGFPLRPIVTAGAKRFAAPRIACTPIPAAASCVPRENFLLSRRTGEVLYILHTFIFCGPKGRTYLSQSTGKRHPLLRPAFERPQWAHPAHTYLVMSPVAHPVGAGVPDGPFSVLRLRAAPASCMYASGGHISFNSERNMEKNARQKPMVFGFPFRPIVTAVQKGSAPDRLHSYPRCRSCVPRENFLLSRRTEKVLYILHTFIFCGPKGRTYLSQSAGKRHPLPRPAFERPQWAHPAPHASRHVSGRAPRRGRTSPTARIGAPPDTGVLWSDRVRRGGVLPRPPPIFCFRMYASGGHISFNGERNMEKNAAKNRSVFGFPFRPIVTAVQKGSAPDRLHSYPCCRSCVPRENFLLSRRTEGSALHPTYFYILRPEGPHLCRCWQKRVAPESEMSPPRASAQNDTPPAEPERYRNSHDLKTCPC